MTDFITTALDVLPTPAALFEAPSHEYVHANRAALDRGRRHIKGLDDRPEVSALRGIGMYRHLKAYVDGSTDLQAFLTEENGWVIASTLPGSIFHARPDLRLVTMHDGLTEDVARLNHGRVIQLLKINEATERAIKASETAMLMLHDSAAGQRSMLDELNAYAAEAMIEDLRDSSRKHLTLAGRTPQG